jgi:hypothetical protein
MGCGGEFRTSPVEEPPVEDAADDAPEGPPDAPAGGAAPQGDTEEAVLAVWREVLGTDAVGADDGFFDVGGNSAALVTVQTRLREALGREVPMVTLFQHPTVRALAAWLDGGGEDDAPAEAGRKHAEERRGMRARRRDARRGRDG